MYLPLEELEKQRPELCGGMDSSYHCVSLARGQVHEVLILNAERGSIICWDFDIMKSDVAFSVFRTKVPITHKEETHAHAHSGQSVGRVPSGGRAPAAPLNSAVQNRVTSRRQLRSQQTRSCVCLKRSRQCCEHDLPRPIFVPSGCQVVG